MTAGKSPNLRTSLKSRARRALCLVAGLLFCSLAWCRAQTPATPAPAEKAIVTVSGDVRYPQRMPWTPDLTLIGVIANSGGLTGFRAPRQVFIIRGPERIAVTLRPVLEGKVPDPKLQPGDKVEVPPS